MITGCQEQTNSSAVVISFMETECRTVSQRGFEPNESHKLSCELPPRSWRIKCLDCWLRGKRKAQKKKKKKEIECGFYLFQLI